MNQLALLDYTFIFDPSETWSNLSQFENQLTKYMSHLGLEAKLVTPINASRSRVVLLSKKAEITPVETDPDTSPKEQADRLRDARPK